MRHEEETKKNVVPATNPENTGNLVTSPRAPRCLSVPPRVAEYTLSSLPSPRPIPFHPSLLPRSTFAIRFVLVTNLSIKDTLSLDVPGCSRCVNEYRAPGTTIADRRTEANVLFEVVVSVRVAMKFPSAMFASVVGTTSSRERS